MHPTGGTRRAAHPGNRRKMIKNKNSRQKYTTGTQYQPEKGFNHRSNCTCAGTAGAHPPTAGARAGPTQLPTKVAPTQTGVHSVLSARAVQVDFMPPGPQKYAYIAPRPVWDPYSTQNTTISHRYDHSGPSVGPACTHSQPGPRAGPVRTHTHKYDNSGPHSGPVCTNTTVPGPVWVP